ncbi:hypothetical protein KJ673_03020 [Patescibacteria group bacterium]|nr:hypothetical protein [Patescibacteria group bacterium]MBU4452886.1 hypothetical protein [Patescibacteria group bacterium]MCG2687994.1 hypothetical protein [Candidatus Parcubacteria bacterium]
MDVKKALETLLQNQAIVINDKTFQPTLINKIHLSTGEEQYWIRSDDSVWLSIDPGSEEVIMLEDIDEELEASDDSVSYAGEDYEFSYEADGKVMDEDGEQIDMVEFREYESLRGDTLRLTEYEVAADIVQSAIGWTITEDDLQEV